MLFTFASIAFFVFTKIIRQEYWAIQHIPVFFSTSVIHLKHILYLTTINIYFKYHYNDVALISNIDGTETAFFTLFLTNNVVVDVFENYKALNKIE